MTEKRGHASGLQLFAGLMRIVYQKGEMVMQTLRFRKRFLFNEMQFLTAKRVPRAGKPERGAGQQRQPDDFAIKLHGNVEVAHMERDVIEFVNSDRHESPSILDFGFWILD